MILWLLLYTLPALAQDPVIEEYCFSSPLQMKTHSSRLKFILVPSDKLEESQSCLTISTAPHRRELIQNYVRKLDPTVKIGFSSVEIKREPCHIEVTKEKQKLRDEKNASVSLQVISADASDSGHKEREVMTIQTLKDFELTVNFKTIKGECRVINPNRYEIKIMVKKEATPLTPPVPPGTVIIVPQAQIPPTQETSYLESTLQLNRGERIELGSVVSNMKQDDKKIDVSAEATLEISNNQSTEKTFLSIN